MIAKGRTLTLLRRAGIVGIVTGVALSIADISLLYSRRRRRSGVPPHTGAVEEERNRRVRRRRGRGSADARHTVARWVICPRSVRAHRHGVEHRETQPNLGWQWRIPRAGTICPALRQ